MALILSVGLLAILFLWTLLHVPHETVLGDQPAEKAKLREHMVADIRGANQYCLAYIALLGVMSAIAANNRGSLAPLLSQLYLWPFGVAFIAASLSTLFIPAGYGTNSFFILQLIWLRTILCEQVAVVVTWYGIWEALGVLLSRGAASGSPLP